VVVPPAVIARIRDEVIAQIGKALDSGVTEEIVRRVVGSFNERGGMPEGGNGRDQQSGAGAEGAEAVTPEPAKPSAAQRLASVTNVAIPKQSCEEPVWTVTLGATRDQGGTRGRTVTIGGHTCMPFHLWEGEMPNRPRVAMEVFDTVSGKYPAVLREIYGGLLDDPGAMARECVRRYGAELISARLEGTHPEKGNRSPEQAVEVVKAVLGAVDVPLIVTGHSHYDTTNEVLKAVAQACAGERLLLNWVEQDNYRTIAGAALAYGHCVVAQSPIDVNIGKQMNILLGNMDVKPSQIVMDPMTGAMGYGIEYTYSVMERIRLTGLGGDAMLAGPMIVSPGQECAKVKELKATEEENPAWGNLGKRAALWEASTAVSLLYAGADVLIMYHPEAVAAVKRRIEELMR
jgi:acetyl-CoA decarbonylase/synthase complex subunit delta